MVGTVGTACQTCCDARAAMRITGHRWGMYSKNALGSEEAIALQRWWCTGGRNMQVGDASASGTAHLLQGQKRQKPCVEMMMR